jgi:predicted RNase H-like HicB family nuclease
MFKYAIVIERGEDNYCAYCPDLRGCVATGASVEETTERIKEAIEFHIEGLKAEGLDVLLDALDDYEGVYPEPDATITSTTVKIFKYLG